MSNFGTGTIADSIVLGTDAGCKGNRQINIGYKTYGGNDDDIIIGARSQVQHHQVHQDIIL